MNRMRMWKRLIVAGTLALGVGAINLLAADYCVPELWAYANGFCVGAGEGQPARECTYDPVTVWVTCADGTFHTIGF